MVRSLPTDALGERRFEDLAGGIYFLVWMDAASGIDFLGLYSADGLQIAPYLSGVASSMRFSQTGRISLGRITPGQYVLRV